MEIFTDLGYDGTIVIPANPKKEEIIQTQFYKEVLSKVYYKGFYGTKDLTNSDYETSGDIYNVSDMFHALKKYMATESGEFSNQQLKIKASDLGTMEIWLNRSRPMTFTGNLSPLHRDSRDSY
jgi:hypothetical protein